MTRRIEESEFIEYVKQNYPYKHPHLLQLEKWKINKNIKIAQEFKGIYSFNFLDPQTCQEIIEETKYFQKWLEETKIECKRFKQVPRFGVILSDLGWYDLFQQLIDENFKEIMKHFFPSIPEIVSHHAFTIEYDVGKEVKLDPHLDDSDVSFNCCLGGEFEGSSVMFLGPRCYQHVEHTDKEEERFEYSHEVGKVLFHWGKHKHLARKLLKGWRVNLIIWCKSKNAGTSAMKCNELCEYFDK